MVVTSKISFNTRGNADMVDITDEVMATVAESGLVNGVVTLFCPSSTSALTTIEFERGALTDFRHLLDQIVPPGADYAHHLAWNDGNGHSHVRSALLGPSLAVPFALGRLTLGTWQQIVYIDFDVRARRRELVVQIMGE
jgi:secondary thiamine-phosphate synthase enzyme